VRHLLLGAALLVTGLAIGYGAGAAVDVMRYTRRYGRWVGLRPSKKRWVPPSGPDAWWNDGRPGQD
jgi:hypothetical protein